MDAAERALWRQANQLFREFIALEGASSKEWLNSLEIAEGVRSRLQQLVEAYSTKNSPLDATLSAWIPEDSASSLQSDLSGRQIGDWVLDVPIGRGGMSTVYRVHRDTDQYEQVAAIKLLNIALVDTQLRGHFDREQRILAGLHHPNIAGLLDAGVSDDGTPYIVMEYVQGHRIDEYVREAELSPQAIVQLFLQVCEAVAFAQQNLIVHRDVKPSNILVNGLGQAKLLDFGIARLLADQDVEATTTRAYTPGYAAPEQLTGQPVTTATDVFGLGAVLFGLLGGQQAFSGHLVDGAVSPPALPTLNNRVDDDLSNIAHMAIRFEPERRYQNAAALAHDLRAWLDNRPVVATPDSRFYRLSKYVRRHRTGMLAAVMVIAVGVAGIAATLWQVQRARMSAAQATATAHRAQAVQDFLLEMFEGADPWSNQNKPLTADQLLDSAISKLPQRLGEFPEQKASVMLAIGSILRNLGRYEEAAVQTQSAIDLWQISGSPMDTVRGQNLLASILIDAVNYDEAEPLLQVAIEATAGTELTQESVEARTTLARLYTHSGKLKAQTDLVDKLLADEAKIERLPDAEQWLGFVYATVAENRENLGAYADAYDAAVKAEQFFRLAHGATHPKVADALGYQSTASFSLGRWDDAERALAATIDILEGSYPRNHPALLWAKYQLGRTLLEGGRFSRALEHYEVFHPECVDLFSAEDPRTVMALTNLGLSYQGVGRLEEARLALEQALPLMRSQSGDNSKVGVALTRYGSVLSQLGDEAGAEREFESGIAFLHRSVGSNHPLYARALSLHAEHLLRYEDAEKALTNLELALPMLQSAYGANSEFTWIANLRRGLANAQIGNTAIAQEQLADSFQGLNQERYRAKYQALLDQASTLMDRL